MLRAAIEYAGKGWCIFPCGLDKTPLTAHGLNDATTDPTTITTWWTEMPTANVAVNCGLSGLAVIDLDVKHGTNGLETWTGLGIEPDGAWISETPSGGNHFIFAGDVSSTTGKIGPGIDTRGRGGYILLPPSKTATGVYEKFGEWTGEMPGPIPARLVDMLKAPKKPTTNTPTDGPNLARLVKGGAPEGERNDSIFRLAARYRALNLDLAEAYVLIQAAAQACIPPFTEKEASACLESAWTHPPGKSQEYTSPPGPVELGRSLTTRRGLGYHLAWPAGLTIDASRIHASSDAIKTELLVSIQGKMVLRSNINLLAARSVKDLVKNLSERTSGQTWPWDTVINQVVEDVIAGEREGDPMICFAEREPAPPPSFLLGLFPKESPSIIYADGGTGKSYLVAALGSIAAAGWKNNPLRLPVERPSTVLILDWETSEDGADWRIRRLHKGMGFPPPSTLFYRRCGQPLADDLEAVSEMISRKQIQLVIIDSLAPASGGDINAAENALRFFQALRTMKGCTTLCVAHVAKGQEGKKTIFGSAFFSNLARCTYELQKQQSAGDDHIELALIHTKTNDGPLLRPIGFTLTYAGDEVRLTLSAEPDLRNFTTTGGPSQRKRIETLLKTEGLLDAKEIADELGFAQNAVRAVVSKMNRAKEVFQDKESKKWGLVQPSATIRN